MNSETQTSQTIPVRAEIAIGIIIIVLLAANLMCTIRAATYQPECIPTIIPTEEIE